MEFWIVAGAAAAAMAPQTAIDKNKDWQLELLMEKIRSKAAQFKNFQDISKNVRMTMLVSTMLLLLALYYRFFY